MGTAARAAEDARVDCGAIDGIAVYGLGDTVGCRELAECLGVRSLNWYLDVHEGGPGMVQAVLAAAMAVDNGLANNVVVVRAMNGRSGRRIGEVGATFDASGRRQWTVPFGYGIPPQMFALWAQRHMFEYGTTTEDLGRVAVTFREHAQRTPHRSRRSSSRVGTG